MQDSRNEKKAGRKFTYLDREVIAISMPRKALEKVEELRGKQPRATFLTEFVCEKLGLTDDDIYVKC